MTFLQSILAPLLRPLGFVPVSSANLLTPGPAQDEDDPRLDHQILRHSPTFPLSVLLLTDSYKLSHPFQYPAAKRYPSTVATLSRKARTIIEQAFEKTCDPESMALVPSRLHDFGFRGCTSVEQTIIGGTAHLLNFEGTDNVSAAYFAQYALNDGHFAGVSIPATEHSVMTSFETEKAAMLHMIETFGSSIFAVVMDSLDYGRALRELLPAVAEAKVRAGGWLVVRPDSGDIVAVVMDALNIMSKVFGYTINTRGFKVITGASVIHGDGVTLPAISRLLDAMAEAGFAAQNVAFGMGAGLLQKVNRDELSLATKLCRVVLPSGAAREVMKSPIDAPGKISLPGSFAVRLDPTAAAQGVYLPVTHAREEFTGPEGVDDESLAVEGDLLQVVYDCGPVAVQHETMAATRVRLSRDWAAAAPVPPASSRPELDGHTPDAIVYQTVSPFLRAKARRVRAEQLDRLEAAYTQDA
ncbi:hypothetical protein H696_05717 [Fonticula alba]|uniref:Nicotinamide phosphoribosyltransferase n=1 Tax=Fonticula alba TaxID=691883 RepID=A0A058Z0H7_FONAL|nr:hypothetical protein H696_05717 [Fonticula alba]KCV67774.1 hypothetical protein H696_05717 [Fonticula alba]|eukprot:XP_009497805.1 hypothetical protein H696_05717 [Fonticula alba]